jgi:hypothetical protein
LDSPVVREILANLNRGNEFETAISQGLFKEHNLLIENMLAIQSKLQPKTYFIVSCHSGAVVYDIERNADKFPVGTNFLIHSGSKYSIKTLYSTSVDQSKGHNIINYVINEYPKTKDALSLFNNNIQKYSETQNFVEIVKNNETGQNRIFAFKARAPKTIENIKKLFDGDYLGTYAYHNDSEHKAANIVILRGDDTFEGYQKYIDSFNALKGVRLEDYPYYSMNELFSHRLTTGQIAKNKYTNLVKELDLLETDRYVLKSELADKWEESLSKKEVNNTKELIEEFTKYNFSKEYLITSITKTFNRTFDRDWHKSFDENKKSTIIEKMESLNFCIKLASELGLLKNINHLKLFAHKLSIFADLSLKKYIALKLSDIPGFEYFQENDQSSDAYMTYGMLYRLIKEDKCSIARHMDSIYSKFNQDEKIFNALISEKVLQCCEANVSAEELAPYIEQKKAFKALTSKRAVECYKLGIKPIDLIPYVDDKDLFKLLTSDDAHECYVRKLNVQTVAGFVRSPLYNPAESEDSDDSFEAPSWHSLIIGQNINNTELELYGEESKISSEFMYE